MTEKQQRIVNAALELFANQGYDAVPTSAIAKEAGVSEGLIFRHFENKLGLLNTIMQMGKEKMFKELAHLKSIEDPGELILTILELPFTLDESEYTFWRLIYGLKWQAQYYDDSMSKPIYELISNALRQLNFEQIEAETQLIMSYMDGFVMAVILKGDKIDKKAMLEVLRKKYIRQ
jgi:AcrR family transcriptional regulator